MYVVPLAQELRHDLIDIDVARRNRRGFPSSSLFPQLNREIGRGVGNVNEVKDEEDFNPAALSQAAEHVEVFYRATPSFQ